MNNKKGFTLVEIMIVVVIIGLLAAIAVPAFQKVRDKTVKNSIINNLRVIASGGQQYLLQNAGNSQVGYNDLLSAGFFKDIDVVAGEDYSTLTVGLSGTLSIGYTGGTASFEY